MANNNENQNDTEVNNSSTDRAKRFLKITTAWATIIAAIIAAIASIFSAYISQQTKDESEKMNHQISQINFSIGEIASQIQHINTQIETIQTHITTIHSDCKLESICTEETHIDKVDKVSQVEAAAEQMLHKLLADYSGVISCNESVSGDSIKLTLTLSSELNFYPENEYLVANYPTAKVLTAGVVDIINELNRLPEELISLNNFLISGTIVGHADQNNIIDPKTYNGPVLQNRCHSMISGINGNQSSEIELISGMPLSENNLLACARAFSIANEIIRAVNPKPALLLHGNAHTTGKTTGEYRGIDVTLLLQNILRIKSDFHVCSTP